MAIKKSSRSVKALKSNLLLGAVGAVIVIVIAVYANRFLFARALDIGERESVTLTIPTGADFDDVLLLLNAEGWLADEGAFVTMARLTGYANAVRPGRYVLYNNFTLRNLIVKLQGGTQDAVNVTFVSSRTLEKIAGVVGKKIEADSAALISAMTDSASIAQMGFTEQTIMAMYLPDTYNVWWNISGEQWVAKMKSEYDKYWTEERKALAAEQNLTPVQVSTLASILDEETNKVDEMPTIASLYLNRLRIGMALQACPTLKFAKGDFSIRRILYEDEKIESPYNTYKYPGLPPGPIRVPSKQALEAVLHPETTKYLYMCARPDGSGRHDFANTLDEHQQNARKYHRALNKKKIYR